MSERIRYSWGQSSLGEFVAAVTARGLAAFEFTGGLVGGDRAPFAMAGRTAGLAALQTRFPGALLVEDPVGLAGLVGQLAEVVEHPEADPGIALDPRGTDYQKRVWSALRAIPAGETTSYGAIAAKLGSTDARDATEAIAANPIAILIPCHRVVKKDGTISGYRWGVARKRKLLEREGHLAPFALA